MNIVILITMIYLHILDDFKLQGMLSDLKQKEFWEKNYPDKLYRYDYITSLFIHGLQWSISITIPIIVYLYYHGELNVLSIDIFIAIMLNTLLHGYIDHLKANKHSISLLEDQLMHMMQIIIVWLLFT